MGMLEFLRNEGIVLAPIDEVEDSYRSLEENDLMVAADTRETYSGNERIYESCRIVLVRTNVDGDYEILKIIDHNTKRWNDQEHYVDKVGDCILVLNEEQILGLYMAVVTVVRIYDRNTHEQLNERWLVERLHVNNKTFNLRDYWASNPK
jgi:hypothetical protein